MSKYADIIDLDYSKIKKHYLSNTQRAAQFQPFSALRGMDEEVIEASKLSFDQKEYYEVVNDILNKEINLIYQNIKRKPLVEIKYFIKNNNKDGGIYNVKRGRVKEILPAFNKIKFIDNEEISIDSIVDVKYPV